MKAFVSALAGRAMDLAQTQPLLALCLGAALLALFCSYWLRRVPSPASQPSIVWTLYAQAGRLFVALAVVLLLAQTFGILRTYLRRSVSHFQQTHGRVTEANYNAVQTIWGAEQTQRELTMQVYYEEEVIDRTEFEDVTKPAIIRKKMVRRIVPGNPFLAATHHVTLIQNARKKGSALYGGYETTCRFVWRLQSPADRPTRGTLRFPLPAEDAMYDELSATINGTNVLPSIQLTESALVLTRDFAPRERLDFAISFKSRGMSHWYFQVIEPREIRDFTLTLDLPGLPAPRLNYPEGCMSPTAVKPTADGRGSVLTYRLDHAISQKGMGIALPELPQPGADTNAVLGEAERGWMLAVAAVLLAMTIANVAWAPIMAALFASALAVTFGVLGDFSDLLFGFWGTAALVCLPLLLLLAWLLKQVLPGRPGKVVAGLLLLFGIVYPAAAGLDEARQSLYLNVCSLIFIAFTAWLLGGLRRPVRGEE